LEPTDLVAAEALICTVCVNGIMGKMTSISVEESTRERLRAFGRHGETWDELVNRMADEAGVPRDE